MFERIYGGNGRIGRSTGEFIAGIVVTLLAGWFIGYNFFGFRIEGVATGDFFPHRSESSPDGLAATESSGGIDSGPIDGTRQDAIDALVSGCTAEGGSTEHGGIPWPIFLVDNTSREEMVFADEPPDRGEWIYFGGNLWVPGRYQSAFAACGS